MAENKKIFQKVEKPFVDKESSKKGKALDEQNKNLEYVCVGENSLGIRTYEVREKQN